MRRLLLAALTLVASLAAASGAQAVVVDMNAIGQPSVAYNSSDQTGYYGVALVPGTGAQLPSAGIPTVMASAPCLDPALASDLFLPNNGLCSHGGAVMHQNETFALTWDPLRRYWQTTRNYVEQFLADVATGSGTLTSPYAVTGQYSDASGRAANASVYGGGCIDYGAVGGSACKFGDANGVGAGNSYPASGCPITGTNQFAELPGGAFGNAVNDVCLTDAQVKAEMATMIAQTQTDVLDHTKPGYTPLVVLLTPPGVEVCLDAAGSLCSANGASTAQFCSYHSQVIVGGTEIAYVVQPWTASWGTPTGCDEPDAPKIPANPPAQTLAVDVGARLVSPLSQGQIAAITNPAMNGWFSLGGSEINDNNGCTPLPNQLDSVTVGSSSQNPYFLQREFNNAGVIETDPNALSCTPSVALVPSFVTPSAVNRGDVVEFDGSTTVSSLIVPNAGYAWNFGDGQTATGPSVVHSYAAGGSYVVKLTVTDRGGNVASLGQTITVLGANGQSVPPVTPPTSTTFRARLQLMPQGLRAVLRGGLAIRLSSNERADGFVTLSIPRAAAARAHLRHGRGATVVIARGTVSGIKAGTVNLHLHLSRGTVAKLGHLRHVTVTVRMALAAPGGDHLAIDVAGRY